MARSVDKNYCRCLCHVPSKYSMLLVLYVNHCNDNEVIKEDIRNMVQPVIDPILLTFFTPLHNAMLHID